MRKKSKVILWVLSLFMISILVGSTVYFYFHTGPISENNILFGRYTDALQEDLNDFGVYDVYENTNFTQQDEKYEVLFPLVNGSEAIKLSWSYATTSTLAAEVERFQPVIEKYCSILSPVIQDEIDVQIPASFVLRDDHPNLKYMLCHIPDKAAGFLVYFRDPTETLRNGNKVFEIDFESYLRVN